MGLSGVLKPSREGTLKPYRAFVQALATDNPFISEHYIANLHRMDKNSRERLLYGNWEYDDDPAKLFELDEIADLFTNKAEDSNEKFISADGGLQRIVWMTTEIKEKLKELLVQRAEELGEKYFVEKIADETITTELEPLVEFLASVNHPALQMEEMV